MILRKNESINFRKRINENVEMRLNKIKIKRKIFFKIYRNV